MATGKPTDTESRRSFLKKTAAAAASLTGVTVTTRLWAENGPGRALTLCIVSQSDDAVVKLPPVQWAIQQLQEALAGRGILAERHQNLEALSSGEECVLVAGTQSPSARPWLEDAGIAAPNAPESLVLARGNADRQRVLLAGGTDARGLMYALLELSDRVRWAADPMEELRRVKRVAQQPANQIRSIARIFASDVEDKEWYYDRSFWQRYLTELANQRFNRFHLTLGLGYDQPIDLRDTYFYFAYPFLVSVPGYDVRATPLSDDERGRNLEMLKFISEVATLRGLHFQLGIWTHAYQWVHSPNANYIIEGLSPQTHPAYCRDALTTLLKACPAINGVTFRIHGESGVAEGSYDFWRTVFDGVVRCGRRVEIDLHAKGIDNRMIELALATELPINISPKYWAEHMGLGYMQGAIRPLEMPPQDEQDSGFFSLSTGSRRFLRYGYGDLLAENRRYGVLHRLWPGTQRLLLWGDPGMAADYGRASSFCGSLGVEWFEPLSFKGRKGSGLPGGRDGYADIFLRPEEPDFEKYLYSYRLWGRHLYDPDCDPDEWRRCLRKEFNRGTAAVATALGQASQILPLITTAHCPSAANNDYWPELYTNMSIVDASHPDPYLDTLTPKRFGAVSPLDPEFFSRIDDFAHQLLESEVSAKYSPISVAMTLESLAKNAEQALTEAASKIKDRRSANFRRVAADVTIQNGIGRFFAWKFRAAALFAIYENAKYQPAFEQALKAYRQARSVWAAFAEGSKDVYRNDLTFGPESFQRGHWQDRLPAIDEDIRKMEGLLKSSADIGAASKAVRAAAEKAIAAVLHPSREPRRKVMPDFHLPPKNFRRGEPLRFEVTPGKQTPELLSLRLHFRHVIQGERWQVAEMEPSGKNHRAQISADYTNSPYPLQYYFELRDAKHGAWLWPGLPEGRGQPYFVVRQA